jgi:hypothetical protein
MSPLPRRLAGALTLALALAILPGCRGDDPDDSPGGPSEPTPLLAPFQGAWQPDPDKSLALALAATRPAPTSSTPPAVAPVSPSRSMFATHPEMKLTNNVAVLNGLLWGEYRFFALHSHGDTVCGKAWHHEDRHDPGDMDKYLVRLRRVGGDLHFSYRVCEDSADPNDPDVATTPLTAGSADTCTADTEKDPPWRPWVTIVFVRMK